MMLILAKMFAAYGIDYCKTSEAHGSLDKKFMTKGGRRFSQSWRVNIDSNYEKILGSLELSTREADFPVPMTEDEGWTSVVNDICVITPRHPTLIQSIELPRTRDFFRNTEHAMRDEIFTMHREKSVCTDEHGIILN